MSYVIFITRNDIPDNDDDAWEHVWQLSECDKGEQALDFINLIKKLMERYPCICDQKMDEEEEDERDFIWSDGPLLQNAGHNITTLGLSRGIDDAIPFIAKTANDMGFVVFDMQDGKIYRPKK